MIPTAAAIFLITLGLAQLGASRWDLRGASLTGSHRWAGVGLGLLLMGVGWLWLPMPAHPATWAALLWVVPSVAAAMALLLLGGSFIDPPEHPDSIFAPTHPQHGGCARFTIPTGDDDQTGIPAVLLKPLPHKTTSAAVCLLHGAGDTKTGFKWRLVRALLTEGLTVLSIDLPGHGDYRHHPLRYPDCLSALPAAVEFLRNQAGIDRVGLLGISLGGAMALKWLARPGETVDALAVIAAPLSLNYSPALRRREARHAFTAPVGSIFREISVRQLRQSWQQGGYVSTLNTATLINLLNPLESIGRINKKIPVALVYSHGDSISPPGFGTALQKVAPQAELFVFKKLSHVTLILSPAVNQTISRWLAHTLRATP